MDVGPYIKQLRTERKMSQEELGALIGVKRAAVQKWECGRVQNLKRDTIKKLSEIFGVNASAFVDGDITDYTPNITEDYVKYPVLGDIAAGYDNIATENWEGEIVDIPVSYLKGRHQNDFFVLRVKGDSMYPLYQENDIVLILKQTTLNNSGDIGAVLYDDELATLKKVEYTKGEDWLRLVPINPSFLPMKIEGEQLEHCRILGIPKLIIREV